MPRRARASPRVDLVVITGYSGAGKSEAIAAFEDWRLLLHRQPPAADDRLAGRAVRATRAAGAPGGDRLRRSRAASTSTSCSPCSTSSTSRGLEPDGRSSWRPTRTRCVDRFKETRRRHPLAPDGRVLEGIRAEREVLGPLRERADVVMDTSDLTGGDAAPADRHRPARPEDASGKLAADDPHLRLQERPAARRRPRPRRPLPAQPALPRGPAAADRPRPRGVDYVEAGDLASEFYGRLLPLLDFLLPAYVAEGKTHLTIAIGCTGGRHRSLTVADRIAEHLGDRDDVSLRVVHRDVEVD